MTNPPEIRPLPDDRRGTRGPGPRWPAARGSRTAAQSFSAAAVRICTVAMRLKAQWAARRLIPRYLALSPPRSRQGSSTRVLDRSGLHHLDAFVRFIPRQGSHDTPAR